MDNRHNDNTNRCGDTIDQMTEFDAFLESRCPIVKEDVFVGIGPTMNAAGKISGIDFHPSDSDMSEELATQMDKWYSGSSFANLEDIEIDCADKCQNTSCKENENCQIEMNLESIEFDKPKMELSEWISGSSFDLEKGEMLCDDTSQQTPLRASFTENSVTDSADEFEQPKPKKRKVEESCIEETKPKKKKVEAEKVGAEMVGAEKVGAKKVGAEKVVAENTAEKKVAAKKDPTIPSYPVAIASAMINLNRNLFLVSELHSEVAMLFPKLGERKHFMNNVRHSLDVCNFFVQRPYLENKYKVERYQYGLNSSQRSTVNRQILNFINRNAENVDERVLQIRSKLQ